MGTGEGPPLDSLLARACCMCVQFQFNGEIMKLVMVSLFNFVLYNKQRRLCFGIGIFICTNAHRTTDRRLRRKLLLRRGETSIGHGRQAAVVMQQLCFILCFIKKYNGWRGKVSSLKFRTNIECLPSEPAFASVGTCRKLFGVSQVLIKFSGCFF